MLTEQTRSLVKATVPVLKEHGVTLTSHFYRRMFSHNPELKHIFNQGHQASGQQQQALAGAVLGYAEHIDDPSVLAPVVMRIAHKHASLGIRAEHYPIVGGHLLASIREVLGEAASDELIAAWAAAYGQLADILIAAEAELYKDSTLADGGWSGYRPFKVMERVEESGEIASFYLVPADGGALPAFKPGQYVSVRVFLPELGLAQPRQYSLSDAPNGRYLRISVKREAGDDVRPFGTVSNHLHATLKAGAVLELSAPMGDFVLHEDRGTPVVLISAGVGQTPMMAMLQTLIAEDSPRDIVYLHAARNEAALAFADTLKTLAEPCPRLKHALFVEDGVADGRHRHAGRIERDTLAEHALTAGADYYLCGPLPFMSAQKSALLSLGVAPERVHYEVFGSDPLTV
ncbi:NO-inducible flavohemoprotein [Crenobacter cavernae]|uniref:Flavohemoprotein n=1 Tax=Crenobacter cavernae TaxID=2290923 RepID=A0A345Y6H3_9NEIS|nr:NO-inducible flavohemoprotein [Crenobacter cavernae]AXK39525.1 NO-inducible flavohemoprotein [Crenobacter cavernae]